MPTFFLSVISGFHSKKILLLVWETIFKLGFNVEFESKVHLRGVLDAKLSFLDHDVEPTEREGKIVRLGSKTKEIMNSSNLTSWE